MSLSHLSWLLAGAVVGFGASFVFGDLLTLSVDLYYLIYATIIVGFLAVYVRRTRLRLAAWASRHLAWACVAGVLGGLVLMQGVLAQAETPHLSGGMLWWALLWRGVVYGAVDGVFLFAFPWIVVWRTLDVDRDGWPRRVGAGAVAWLAILFLTTTYHLGYADFRSAKILQPNIGSTIGAVPTLITGNPMASIISHVVLHVTAVVHAPHTDLFLPPHRPQQVLE